MSEIFKFCALMGTLCIVLYFSILLPIGGRTIGTGKSILMFPQLSRLLSRGRFFMKVYMET